MRTILSFPGIHTFALFLMTCLSVNAQNKSIDGFSAITGSNVPFYTNLDIHSSAFQLFNRFSSFGSRVNGLKGTVNADKFRFLALYGYQNYDGYRQHSNEYWNRMNLLLETGSSDRTSIRITGDLDKGEIKRPGSLTRQEYEEDPYQADQRSVNRDEKRISTKGNVTIRYETKFGKNLNNKVEITPYGTIESFIRSTREYTIINKYELGLGARYINTVKKDWISNEFSAGGSVYLEPEREEEYENFSGQQSDQLEQLLAERSAGQGCFVTDRIGILGEKLFFILHAGYGHNVFNVKEETLPSRSDSKVFQAFTPEFGLEYKVLPWLKLEASYKRAFESPEIRQMESPDPATLYNHDLTAQTSGAFIFGLKGDLERKDPATWFRRIRFEAVFRGEQVHDEIVQFEVYSDLYYRNAGRTDRLAAGLDAELELIRNLVISLTYGWKHFRYDSYVTDSWETDSASNLIVVRRDYSGNRSPNVPDHLVKLALSYKYPIIRQVSLVAGAGYTWSGKMWVDDANSDRTDAYNLLDAMLALDMKFCRFTVLVSGGVQNILGEVYTGVANINSADKRFFYAAPPRNFYCSLNLGYHFK